MVLDRRFGTGYELPDGLGMVRGILRQPRLVGGAVVTENGVLMSEDYSAGSQGWAIFGDGSVEFNNGTFRGDLESSNYVTGVSGWQLLQSGNAEFQDVVIRGTITQGSEIDGDVTVVTGGALQSDNYVASTSGWMIDGDGDAEFNDVIVRGDIIATSFSTGVPNNRRVEIEVGDVGQILFWDDTQTTNPGFIQAVTTGSDIGIQMGAGSNVIRMTPNLGLTEIFGQVDLVLSGDHITVGYPSQDLLINTDTIYRHSFTAAPWDEENWKVLGVDTGFENGWGNFGGGFQGARYRKVGGQVEIQGTISGGTVTARAWTLPAGYRPAATLGFPAIEGGGGFGRVDIDSSGFVVPQLGSNAAYVINIVFTPG